MSFIKTRSCSGSIAHVTNTHLRGKLPSKRKMVLYEASESEQHRDDCSVCCFQDFFQEYWLLMAHS